MGEMRISVLLFVPFQNFDDLGLMNVGLGLGGPIIPIGIARGALVASGADVSMTQLLSHTFARLTGSSFRLKAKLLPIKNILGVKYN